MPRTQRTSSTRTITRARELRKRLTEAEQLVWARLRRRGLDGYRFRRQHPIGPYIADFYCVESSLVVELDGLIHAEPERREHDRLRDAAIRDHGLRVVRFDNNDVFFHLTDVIATIRAQLAHPNPFPHRGKGQG